MNYRDQLLADLREYDYVNYGDKRVIGHRMPLLQEMELEGLITMKVVGLDNQESYLEVRLKEAVNG